MDKQKHGKPHDNRRQNKQVRDAAQSAGLTTEQRERFRRRVEIDSRDHGENFSFDDLVAIAREFR